MKKNKGFTLIELLAVIVILAIIALIATPIVLNMINNARKKAAESSAYGFIDAIEYNNGFANTEQPGYTEINGENLDVTSSTFNNLKLKGKKPTSGTVTIVNGKVTSATGLCFNDYKVNYDGRVASVEGKCDGSSSSTPSTPEPNGPTKVAAGANDTHKGIVYMDPTNLSTTCNATLAAANVDSTTNLPTGIKTGCMKFYIYDDSGDTYKMILDHNTTAKVAYETSGTYKEYAQASIKTTVDDLVTTTGWQVTPRLITTNEIATITNTSTFDGSSSKWFYFNGTGENKQTQASSSQGDNEYAWLFDYTGGCTSYGCNTAGSSTSGYWTSSPVSDDSYSAWYVYRYGNLERFYVDDDYTNGIRPVITIPKTSLQ